VNDLAVESFKTEDSIDQLFAELQKLFLPCFYQLVCSTAAADRDAVDDVRGCWCEVLSIDHPGLLPSFPHLTVHAGTYPSILLFGHPNRPYNGSHLSVAFELASNSEICSHGKKIVRCLKIVFLSETYCQKMPNSGLKIPILAKI